MIDLRSDTVTKPTKVMREIMFNADVGDDVMQEDITVNKLQQRIANLFSKEDALFFPSGTMSNLTAMLTWCNQRGSEVIVGDKSHIFLFEQTGASQFGGISLRTIPNLPDGTMEIQKIMEAVREEDIHEPVTKLICIENTHNVCGGTVLPLEFLQELRGLSKTFSIPIHLDGARVWNAIAKQNIQPYIIAEYADSLTVCLSKGLGAPVGSVLIGTKEFIHKARRIRKALGGGMRQVGILAAAGLQSLDDFESGLLLKDHQLTRALAEGLFMIPYLKIDITKIQTNIIFADVITDIFDAFYISKICKINGILISAWSPKLLRFVLHRDINDYDIKTIIETLQSIHKPN